MMKYLRVRLNRVFHHPLVYVGGPFARGRGEPVRESLTCQPGQRERGRPGRLLLNDGRTQADGAARLDVIDTQERQG